MNSKEKYSSESNSQSMSEEQKEPVTRLDIKAD